MNTGTQSAFKKRLKLLKANMTSFLRSLRWKDFYPIEEKLAIVQVKSAGWFLIAPLFIILSGIVTWFLFPEEMGTDSAGLAYGSLAIVFMAWALLLATQSRILEFLFGGFDRLHVWHRWAGIAAVVFLFLHTSSENEVRNGVAPFGSGAEEAGLVFASPAQTILVTLVIISILRILPYRIWRFSHIAIIIPFLFSAWHGLTAERPTQTFTLSGIWLWFWVGVGFVSFMYRLFVIDSGILSLKMKVVELNNSETMTRLTLRSLNSKGIADYRPGQFLFLRVGGYWKEPHPFSIVRTKNNQDSISVFFSKVGDWTNSVAENIKLQDTVLVSRPHGHLNLKGKDQQVLWIAGGSGITPFLQDEKYLRSFEAPPTLVFFFRGEESALGLTRVNYLSQKGLINVKYVDTTINFGEKTSFYLDSITPQTHVAVCGPRSLVVAVLKASRKKRASSAAFEIYDYRSPFGPNLNELLRGIIQFILPAKWFSHLGWMWDSQQNGQKEQLPTTQH